MKINCVKLYLLVSSVLFLGCETVVEIDVPFNDRVLVVNSLFNADSTWRVTVSASRHVLANERTTYIQNATVSIHDPVTDEQLEVLTKIYAMDEGTYGGQLTPERGKEYKIKVAAPGYAAVEAVDFAPAAVPILKAEVDTSNLPNTEIRVSVDIHFNDPSGVENFYQVMFVQKNHYLVPTNDDPDTVYTYQPINFSVDDPALGNSDDSYLDEFVISDRLFHGKSHILSFKLDTYHFLDGYNRGDVIVYLKSVSKSFYEYKTTVNLQKSVSGDPFAQPVQVFNNIQNGLGIFAGYSQVEYDLKK